ncbi:MAG: hypothetical protein CW742_11160 [Methanoregula sp.]|nr:MAG: hypothetical protein CW742_11160 [Methanoregula sp.]
MTCCFESLVTGTARQSKLILDNLGIIVSIEDANEKYAKSIGKSVSALTDQEQRLAFQAAMLEQSDDLINSVDLSQKSFNETVRQADTAMREIQMTMSKGLIPLLQPLADGLKMAAVAARSLPEPLLWGVGILGALFAVSTLVIGALLTQQLLMGLLAGTEMSFAGATVVLTGTYVNLATAVWTVAGAMGALLIEMLPFIIVGAAIAAVIWAVWDVMDKGWEDSEFKKFMDYLVEPFPILVPLVNLFQIVVWALTDALTWLGDKLEPVWKRLKEISDHPLFKMVAGTALMMVPGGQVAGANMMYEGYAKVTGAMDSGAGTGSAVIVNQENNMEMKFGDFLTKQMTQEEYRKLVKDSSKDAAHLFGKQTERDIRSVGGI